MILGNEGNYLLKELVTDSMICFTVCCVRHVFLEILMNNGTAYARTDSQAPKRILTDFNPSNNLGQ